MVLLQAATIILLLASLSGSHSTPSVQHLCGSNLVDALYHVCGLKGFFHSNRGRRDLDNLLVLLSNLADYEVAPLKEKVMKKKRGIVERCCHRPCTIYHLEDYCS